MTAITKESLADRIIRLENAKALLGGLSMQEEYQLDAYRLLLERLPLEPVGYLMRTKYGAVVYSMSPTVPDMEMIGPCYGERT